MRRRNLPGSVNKQSFSSAKVRKHIHLSVFFLGVGFLVLFIGFFSLPEQARVGMVNFLSYASVQKDIAQEMEYQESAPKLQQETDGVILHGDRTSNKIALTFDGEMTNGMRAALLSGQVKSSYDRRITDTLNQTQTKATFFLTGMWMQLYPKETKALAQNPLFELASHSYADTSFDGYCYGLTPIPDSQDIKDIEFTQGLLQMATNSWNTYFRFPGGCYSKTDLDIVTNQAKLTVVHWDVVGEDGFNNNTEQIVQNVVSHTQNGSIIILHLNGAPTAPKTADALPEIITELKAKGFEFVTVSQLLNR
ncbi:MAG: polysaccharide deacetylase family protein [Patescibacteria group bacterium]|nr:polysaccharide deacetylase family protein [Patescibacteria group bacterium]MDE2590189.1 polysaccharide deacetylase family protein [Patescibacteria group bacterium]